MKKSEVSSDFAYDYIRRRILNGEFPPGMQLSANALATQIGVSRTPVRDALRQLETDGLVVIKAHSSASVMSLDLQEFQEAGILRLALESYAAGLAAKNRTESDLMEMRLAIDGMRQATQRQLASPTGGDQGMQELTRDDVRFHIAVVSAARCGMLKKEILRLHLINRVMTAALPAGSYYESPPAQRNQTLEYSIKSHEEIFDAISRGSETDARAAMEVHLQHNVDISLRKLSQLGKGASRELTEDELVYTA